MRHFSESPVLRELLRLSALTALSAALATVALSLGIAWLLSLGRGITPLLSLAPVGVTAIALFSCKYVNEWSAGVGVSESLGLCALFGVSGLLALGLMLLLRLLLWSSGGNSAIWVAGFLTLGWAAVITNEFALSFAERRMLLLVLAALGLLAVQARGVLRLSPARSRVALTWVAWGAGVVLPLAVTLLAPYAAARATPTARADAPSAPKADGPAPNVIIVMIDTLRADYTSLGSDDAEATPNLLALAAEGATYFSRAIAAAPSTAPSVKAFFTSRSPSHWGLAETNESPPSRAWRLPQSFQEGGYQTAAISANPLVTSDPYSGGFDYFWSAGGYRFWQRSFLLHVLLSGHRLWPIIDRVGRLELDKVRGSTVRRVASGWLDTRAPNVPFLLYVHFMDPHWPYYERGYFEPSPQPERGFSHVDYLRLNHGDPSLAPLRRGANIRHLRHVYREEVRHTDEELSLFVADLESRGLMDDSILLVLGDHGEEFLEHNGFSHGHDVYEEQVHVPLLIHWPRTARYADMPKRVDGPVSLLDIAPTLVELLDLPGAPRTLDGSSFAARLREGAVGGPVTSESSLLGRSHMAYREGDLKVRVEYDEAVPPWESEDAQVMDLVTDPRERRPQEPAGQQEWAHLFERARTFFREHRRQSR